MKRRAGILAPVFSLPGRYGIGDFGASAYRFVDLLAGMGVRIWQVLPLNPLGYGESPYQPFSSFAGETLYGPPVENSAASSGAVDDWDYSKVIVTN